MRQQRAFATLQSRLFAPSYIVAALACGIPPQQLSFMDLRFYRTGTVTKAPLHPQDIADTVALLQQLQPAQIYVAGELSERSVSRSAAAGHVAV